MAETQTPEPVVEQYRPNPGPQEMAFACTADIMIFGGSAGGSKMLPLDTPVLTLEGFKTIGTVAVGDIVFAETGEQTQVTHVHPIDYRPESIELELDTGEFFTACDDHLWHTFDYKQRCQLRHLDPGFRAKRRANRKSRAVAAGTYRSAVSTLTNISREHEYLPPPVGSVVNTRTILENLKHKGRTNHAIPVMGSIECDARELPIDPYVLGFWLGDGTAKAGQITCPQDLEVLDWIGEHYPKGKPVIVDGAIKSQTFLGLRTDLRKAGVFDNKHVPAEYLTSSREQRLEILKGLMDSDGCCDKGGRCSFSNTNEQLARDTCTLINSLGWKATVREYEAKLYGRYVSQVFAISFTPDEIIFKLKRKSERQKLTPIDKLSERKWVYIVNAKRVDPVPMRCITVDHESGTYAIGSNLRVTHNSNYITVQPLAHVGIPGFTAIIFRRTQPQITQPGGLWAETQKWYPHAGGKSHKQPFGWEFPTKEPNNPAVIALRSMQYEDDKLQYQGGQFAVIEFDELTHFSESQFFYMMSRNRSDCGVKPYMRGTCNPDASSWVARLISWWIDPKTGLADKSRSGVIRWFYRSDDKIQWYDSREEAEADNPEKAKIARPKSFTFISASVTDNPKLLEKDPDYMASLMGLPKIERMRLLDGNWKIDTSSIIETAWVRHYDKIGDQVSFVRGGTDYTGGSHPRFAVIDTAGTSRQKAAAKKGKKVSYTCSGVFDYQSSNDVVLQRDLWRERVSWNEMLTKGPKFWDKWGVRRLLIENAHFGPALYEEMKDRYNCELISTVVPGMKSRKSQYTNETGQSIEGAKLERAVASGMLSALEFGNILFSPDAEEWTEDHTAQITSWKGLDDEAADITDILSYAWLHRKPAKRGLQF